MNLNLKNKKFIISGSNKGIGLKIAESLLGEGAKVLITGRTKKLLKAEFKKLHRKYGSNILHIAGDITDKIVLKKIKNLVHKKWKKIDGVVANAG